MGNTETEKSKGCPDFTLQVPDKGGFVYYFNHPTAPIVYLIEKKMFHLTHEDSSVTTNDVLRYIKGLYPEKEIFERDELSFIKKDNEGYGKNHGGDGILNELISLLEGYDNWEPFTIKEASEIQNDAFKANVMDSIAP